MPPGFVKFGKDAGGCGHGNLVRCLESARLQRRAIAVPGVSAASLSSAFEQVAKSAGWTVKSYPKPDADRQDGAGDDRPDGDGRAHRRSRLRVRRDGVLYEIITDDQALLQDALIQMP